MTFPRASVLLGDAVTRAVPGPGCAAAPGAGQPGCPARGPAVGPELTHVGCCWAGPPGSSNAALCLSWAFLSVWGQAGPSRPSCSSRLPLALRLLAASSRLPARRLWALPFLLQGGAGLSPPIALRSRCALPTLPPPCKLQESCSVRRRPRELPLECGIPQAAGPLGAERLSAAWDGPASQTHALRRPAFWPWLGIAA